MQQNERTNKPGRVVRVYVFYFYNDDPKGDTRGKYVDNVLSLPFDFKASFYSLRYVRRPCVKSIFLFQILDFYSFDR